MKKRVLFIGGSGLLALNWALIIKNRYDVVLALHNREIKLQGTQSVIVDTSSFQSLALAISQIKPDIIINTAGLTSVELCEEFPERAVEVNTNLALNLAKVSSLNSIKFVHISTDHLFSGQKMLVDENEPIDAQNMYGITKANAESEVLNNNAESLILRTNFYGWGTGYRSSFSDVIIKALRERRTIKLFTDVYYTPILIQNLVEVVHRLIEIKASGIFNIVSDTRVSKFEFGLCIADIFGLDNTLIHSALMSQNRTLVKRPLDMSLSNRKVSDLLGIEIGTIDQQIKLLYEQEVSGFNSKIIKL
jgi:dTDP-4-dehydrorhamnose reductase